MENNTKILYYTDQSQIEVNALNALKAYEQHDAIDRIAVFPDIHYCSEKSIPVGVAFSSMTHFFPMVTGKDMGCGVGFLIIDKDDCLKPFDKKHYNALEKASQTMTDEGLGGGNHFLSIEEDNMNLYIIVHTGSRNRGIYMYQESYALAREFGDEFGAIPIEHATDEYIANYNGVLEYAATRRKQFVYSTLDFLKKNGYVDSDLKYNDYFDSVHNSLDFTENGVIHRKGSTKLDKQPVAIPLSMSRGTLLSFPNIYHEDYEKSLRSCSHGAGRKYSRTDTLKQWHSMKKAQKQEYKQRFSEILQKDGEFPSSIIQEFDFAYKNSDELINSQPHLYKAHRTSPIITVKFMGV